MLGVAPESGLRPRVLELQGLFCPLSAYIMSGPQTLKRHSSSFVWFPVSVAAAPQVLEGKPTAGLLRDSLLGLSCLSPWSYGRNREICSLKGTFQGNSSKSLPAGGNSEHKGVAVKEAGVQGEDIRSEAGAIDWGNLVDQ